MKRILSQELSALVSVTDRLGRSLPSPLPKQPAKRRLVGLFYFLWLGEHGRHAPHDIAKIIAADPMAGYHPHSALWGDVGTYHHWGEPLFGYYYSDDEWVMRRHIKLFLAAGIDFLFLDVTNAVTYDRNTALLLSILKEYRADGFPVPKILFYTNTASGQTVHHLYERYFKSEQHSPLWLFLDKKPVIIARSEECTEEERLFFDIRPPQWPNEPAKEGGWPWMDFDRPQRLFRDPTSELCVMNASVAQHPQLRFGDSVLYGEGGNRGRSFHHGASDPAPDALMHGYNLAEQIDRALTADPDVLLLTGWNEWIAGRWNGTEERPIMFVDTASPEYSRDIEMMRGGYGDLYYLQMVDAVRRFKGATPLPRPEVGDSIVLPGFTDGGMHRHAEGYGTVYHNVTPRNAIRRITVHFTAHRIRIRIETAAPLSDDRSGVFLRTYLATGDGIAFAVLPQDGRARLCPTKGLAPQKAIGSYLLSEGEREISFAIPYHVLKPTGDFIEIKVADAAGEFSCTDDFYDVGDTFPCGALLCRIPLPDEIVQRLGGMT